MFATANFTLNRKFINFAENYFVNVFDIPAVRSHAGIY